MKVSKFEKDEARRQRGDTFKAAEAEQAIMSVDNFRYAAMRQFYWPIWPQAGEIRDELDNLQQMPAFERDALMSQAGFYTQQENDLNDRQMREKYPDAQEVKPNHL